MRSRLLAELNSAELELLSRDWPVFAHAPQRPPLGDFRTWLMLGGRGAGKTRAGAEWITAIVQKDRHYLGDSAGKIALVGETYHDVRQVMIEGNSGLLSVQRRDWKPDWSPTLRRLRWPNGATAQIFSANDPDGLRGNQFGLAWCDELAKWPYVETTWNMLQFCMRLGRLPRQLVTTTPKPLRILKKLIEDKSTIVTRSGTQQNAAHLANGFLDYVLNEYGGTRLGRQEIDGEIIEANSNALWSLQSLDLMRVKRAPKLNRIIVAVDPPATSSAKSDACGIVAAGKDSEGQCYVLADATVQGKRPEEWARVVSDLFNRLSADCVVAESNQGGEMVETVLAVANPCLPVRLVRASRGKWLRAEPVALLYARSRVHHVGSLPELEDEMCDFAPDGLAGGRSPDRLDALVWALTELALKHRGEPRVRQT